MRVLVLGGTTEAGELARALAARPEFDALLSLAGRTSKPAQQPLPTRVGGFGGAAALARFLREGGYHAMVDATHPFAERMSFNAAEAAGEAGVPLVALVRAPWTPGPGDSWTEVPDAASAAHALGDVPRTVFLTVGRLSLPAFAASPQHHYVVRSIDPPDPSDLPPRHRLVLDRGPFDTAAEERLMRDEGVEVVVTKNSGGKATEGKLAAARRLGLPVIMIARPRRPDVLELHGVDEVLDWLAAHRPAP
jgi:precorrin-6A/cobalt-precorrin-6A reductase